MTGQDQSRYALLPERLFDGASLREGVAVVIEGEHILELCDAPRLAADLPRRPVAGLLAPGLVDLQLNGGGGCQWNDDPSVAGLQTIAAAHRRHGTTGWLPTLISPSRLLVEQGLDALSSIFEKRDVNASRILGIHLEGPHLNPARHGAHPEAALRPLEDADMAQLIAQRSGATLCTVAPEIVGCDAIRSLTQNGVIVFAGHSEANADLLDEARAAGLRGVTHLYNAMAPLRAREPGVVGSTLSERETFCSLIADGVHVDWRSVAAALAAKGADRLFFVSDAMAAAGGDDAPFSLGARRVRVLGVGDRRYCALDDGTLAGSCLTMAAAMRNAISALRLPIESALKMASTTPARALGLCDTLGTVQSGALADLVAFDGELQVLDTWVAGTDHQGRRA